MPGKIPRPSQMRDALYLWNWKMGYAIAAMTVIVLPFGAAWVMYKRKRYDRFFEEHGTPEKRQWVADHTVLTPQKYAAFIERMQGEVAAIKEKYEQQ